jgi:outer membrane protein assembly factor BamB
VIFGGVRLERGSSDLRAIDIRTGKAYWWYHQHGKSPEELYVDRAGGDAYLTWRGDRSCHLERFDRINIRTGKILWRQDIAGLIARAGGEEDEGKESVPAVGGIQADVNTTVFLTRHVAIVLAHDNGRQRWIRRQPKGCWLVPDSNRIVAEAGTLVVLHVCTDNHGDEDVLGRY